jgi:hypothetical protein
MEVLEFPSDGEARTNKSSITRSSPASAGGYALVGRDLEGEVRVLPYPSRKGKLY